MKDDTPFDWGVHTLPPEGDVELALGPLQLHLRRIAGEIRIRFFRTDELHRPAPAADEEDLWIRWIPSRDWSGELALTPGFPDRPVVVRPDNEFRLMQESEARIYIRIPLELHVEALGPHRHTLLQVPTRVLSDTWWGSPEEGRLHYFLDTKARRTMADHEFKEHLAICPMELRNVSDEDLLVSRIALDTKYLTLYKDGTRLWSDETTVRYRGDDQESSLSVTGRPPREAPEAELVRPAREDMGRSFRASTFARQIRSSFRF
ncbi:MAG: DUF432 domain-containing protein [Gemmatimonadota bacterium]